MNTGDLTSIFVEVLPCHMAKTVMRSTHIPVSKGRVRFMRLNREYSSDGNTALARSGSILTVDLETWCESAAFNLVVGEAMLYSVASRSAVYGNKRQRLDSQLVLHGGMERVETDEALAVLDEGGAAVDPMSLHRQLEMINVLGNAGAVVDHDVEEHVNIMDFDSYDASLVEHLMDQGVVDVAEDAFGDTRLALVPSGTQTNMQFVVEPRCHFIAMERNITPASSKLECLAEMIRDGWVLGPQPTELTVECHRCYHPRMLGQSRWTWVALAKLREVFSKGVGVLWVGMAAKYYEYILAVKDTTELTRYGDSARQWPHQCWVDLLASRDPLLGDRLVDALPDDEGGDEPAVPQICDDPPTPDQQALVKQSEDLRKPVTLRFKPSTCGRTVKVNMDRSTHQSGKARMWCDCSCHRDEGCVKYRFVHHFPNERSCAIWLCAWNLESHLVGNRTDHVLQAPSIAAIDQASALFPDC